jgi:hypothetical protein
MKTIPSPEHAASEIGTATPDLVEVHALKLRRAKWYHYVRRRFDLVPLKDLAEWCAREPQSINLIPHLFVAATDKIYESISLGEFGDGDWPSIAYLPAHLPTYAPGRFPLRLTCGQYADPGLPRDKYRRPPG